MNEPLARVSFEFGLDELMDITRRSTGQLHPVRQRHLVSMVLVLILTAVLTPTLLCWASPDSPPAVIAVATASAVTFGYLVNRRASKRRVEKLSRDILRKMYGDGRHQCDIELHRDRMTMHQIDTSISIPWSQVDSLVDDHGDLVITGQRGVTVIRKFAFPDDEARSAFLDQMRQLVQQHREHPAS